jgi:hypothetical protein
VRPLLCGPGLVCTGNVQPMPNTCVKVRPPNTCYQVSFATGRAAEHVLHFTAFREMTTAVAAYYAASTATSAGVLDACRTLSLGA